MAKTYDTKTKLPSQVEEPLSTYLTKGTELHSIHQDDFDNKIVYLNAIRRGVDYDLYARLMETSKLSLEEMARLLHVNSRTLRRLEDSQKLNPEMSERIIELVRLYQIGLHVFGDLSYFNQWLNAPILALGRETPKSFLDTSFGIDIVRDVLGRIENGVYS